jgi:prepilin peptidase dependent protein B
MLNVSPARQSQVAQHRQAGLSMVELMVGVAIGLFVVAGATMAVSNQLGDNRRVMLETQIQQDLRTAADMITRDVRRSGYWVNAQAGVWHAGAVSVDANPHAALTPASGVANEVRFEYSRGNPLNEDAGFQLVDNTIKMRVGGQWQALTDSTTLRITDFRVTLNSQNIALACFNDCPGGGTACWPTQTVREVEVFIDGTAVHDPSLRRNARSNVRLRNDIINGACPA